MTDTRSAETPPAGRYAVLGAAGLMGSHALLALADTPGVQVRAVYHRRRPQVPTAGMDVVQADLTDPAAAATALSDVDAVLSFAGVTATAPVLARDPLGPVTANLRIATNVFEAAWRAGVRKCVWMSSTMGYPGVDAEFGEDDFFSGTPPAGWRAMGEMTRYAERLARTVAEDLPRRMPIVALRPTLVYGEYDHTDDATSHFLPALVRRVVAREPAIEVWGDGTQRRDVIHAADVVRCAFAALDRVEGFDAFNVAAGETHTVNEILHTILEVDGYADAQVVHRADRPIRVATRRFAAGKARRDLGFAPEIGLAEGLGRTVAWMRAGNLKSGAA